MRKLLHIETPFLTGRAGLGARVAGARLAAPSLDSSDAGTKVRTWTSPIGGTSVVLAGSTMLAVVLRSSGLPVCW